MKLFKPTLIHELIEIRTLYKERAEWLKGKEIDQWSDVDTRYGVERLCKLAFDGNLYALELGGKIVASAVVFYQDKLWENVKDFPLQNTVFIHGIVSKQVEGKHYGRLLLKCIEAKMLLAGKCYIALDCRAENVALNEYYTNYGFKEIDNSVTYSTNAKASLKAKYIR